MSTKTVQDTLAAELTEANPARIADALRQVDLGRFFAPQKWTFAALASAAAQDITTAAAAAAATAGGTTPALAAGQLLPIRSVVAVRVTAGAAAAGVRMIGDAGATASATVAKLSDDGKTLTFEDTVTAFVLEYIPRSAVDPSAQFATQPTQ